MAPVTEIATLSLKAGTSIEPTTETGKTLEGVLDTLRAQPGLQRVYYATEIENPSSLRLFVDWDSLDAHKQFMAASDYGPFLKNFGSILDGSPTLVHAEMKPHPAPALSASFAPCTEVFIAYFDPNSYDASAWESHVKMALIDDEPGAAKYGYQNGFSGGWIIEQTTHQSRPLKAYIGTAGWSSQEAHVQQFGKSDAHQKYEKMLRDTKGLIGLEGFHLKMAEAQPGQLGVGQKGGVGQEEVLNPQAGVKSPPSTRSDGTSTKFERREDV